MPVKSVPYEGSTQSRDVFVCTAEDPWTKEKWPHGPVNHTARRKVGDCGQGCCTDYTCDHCKHNWRHEWPD